MAETVKVWDAHGCEMSLEEVHSWNSWSKCREDRRFPKGLVEFLEHKEGCAFPAPTNVQAYSWPVLIQGQDLISIAKTGSGKTLAFLLPGFMWLKKNKKSTSPVDCNVGPAILVMTPTRELCFQIFSDAQKFGEPVQISAACAYGGAPKKDQEWKLKEGPETLIATPGRLNDFINNGVVSLEMCRYTVLDEADRMLDMGFEPQIKEILAKVPNGRQTAMFTATWSKECRKIADAYIHNPVHIQIGADEMSANADITQHIEITNSDAERMAALKRILEGLGDSGNVLIFCNTKKKCRELSWELDNQFKALKAVELHGDLEQWQRDESLNKFRSGDVRILAATDVAARGLDIRNVSVVVNFDAPNNAEDYVHRIGRTGRAGDAGDAHTFLSGWGDEKKAGDIYKIMEKSCQAIPKALEDLVNGGSRESTVTAENASWGGAAEAQAADNGGGTWDKQDWGEKKNDDGAEWWKKDEKKAESWDEKPAAKAWDQKPAATSWDAKPAAKSWDDKKQAEGSSWGATSSWDSKPAASTSWKGESDNVRESDPPWRRDEPDNEFGGDNPEEGAEFDVDGYNAPDPDEWQNEEEDRGGRGLKRGASNDFDSPPDAKRFETDGDIADTLTSGRGGQLSVTELRDWLEAQGLATHGVKSALLERATQAAVELCTG